MNKKLNTLVLCTLSVFLCSCHEMDFQNDGRAESEQSIYEYFQRAYQNANLAYYYPTMTGIDQGLTAGGYMLAGYCDEAQEVSRNSDVYDYYDGKSTPSSMSLLNASKDGIERWSSLFAGIRTCNTGIKYLSDENLNSQYDDNYRRTFMSQLYCVRALDYLYLIKRWGGVPIIDENDDEDDLNLNRASFAQCVDFIFESCDKAIESDPDMAWFRGNQNNSPKMSKGTLMAIKSEAALYAASRLNAEDYSGTEKYTWERVAKITKTALDSVLAKGGRLVNENTSFPIESATGYCAYDKLFLSSYPWTLSWDTETISQPNYYGSRRCELWKYNGIPLDDGQETCGACPSQNLVDAYDVISPDGTKAVPLLDLRNPYNSDGTPNFNPAALALGYEDCSEKMYENRDPRFYGTIYYDGSVIDLNGENVEIQTSVGGNCGINLSPLNIKHTCTGYYLRKFINPTSGADNGNKDGYLREFRLAELYLNFAEAAYMAYGADAPVSGMTAREAANCVRARVGLPGIDENGEDFLLRLKNERRVELAFEEHRYYDVRRWSDPKEDLSKTDKVLSGINITVSDNGEKRYERIYFDRNCYSNKYLRLPIPLDEVRKMLAITNENWQNEGWN